MHRAKGVTHPVGVQRYDYLGRESSPDLDNGSERGPSRTPNLVLFRSTRNDLPFALSACALAGLSAWIGTKIVGRSPPLLDSGPVSLPVLFFGVALAMVFFVSMFRRYNVRYLIADDGVLALRGVLSNCQVEAKLEYYQIRGTEIQRSLFERMINTGDLYIRGSADTRTDVTFKGIYDPYRVQMMIQERHRSEVQGSTGAWINK